MIIILHQNQPLVLEFTKYLTDRGILHYLISLEEIILDTKIIEKWDYNKTSNWIYNGKNINFQQVSGVYNFIYNINDELFEHYVVEDRNYIKNEWRAYLNFRLYNINSVNPITKELLSGIIYSLPFIYNLASFNSFDLPKYVFSTKADQLGKSIIINEFINLKTIYNDIDITSPGSHIGSDTIGIIEYLEGSNVLVNVIGDKVLSFEEKLPFDLLEKCLNFNKSLNLSMSQLIFRKTKNNRFVFYNFTPFPYWEQTASFDNKTILFQSLTKLVYS